MKTIIAVIAPPLAMLAWGTRRQWLVSLLLTAAFYLPGSVYAAGVVNRK